MSNLIAPLDNSTGMPVKSGFLNRWAKDMLCRQLDRLSEGQIYLHSEATRDFGKPHADFPQPVQLYVDDERFYGDAVFGGSIGAAEAYMSGFWRCSDLVDLARLLVRNRHGK